jgi:hypothetical protein
MVAGVSLPDAGWGCAADSSTVSPGSADPRLHQDGSVTLGHQALDVGAERFPADTDIELLAESGGIFQRRFLMTPATGGRPTLDQRLLAVALADQVGAALATSHPVDQS